MKNLMKKVRGFINNEEGQGLVEYALIIAVIALAVIAAMTVLRSGIGTSYNNAAAKLGAGG